MDGWLSRFFVTCASVESMLLEAKIISVDLWVLDIEGAEADALSSLQGKVAFHVIMVETMPGLKTHAKRRTRTTAAMIKLGMTLNLTYGYDDFWVNMSYVPSAKPYDTPPGPALHHPPHCPLECASGKKYDQDCADKIKEDKLKKSRK